MEILVSPEDLDLLARPWRIDSKGYPRRGSGISGRYDYLHRVVALRMGLIDPSAPATPGGRWTLSIDHINGVKHDARRSNLRLADRKTQMRNPANQLRSDNTSGTRGVYYIRNRGTWHAKVFRDGKFVHLGSHATREEAAAARAAFDRAS